MVRARTEPANSHPIWLMFDTTAVGFALGAGLVAALNPCGFALLPTYLGLVIAGSNEKSSRPVIMARAAAATLALSAGFLTIFGLSGMLISPLIAAVHKYLPFATVIIGTMLVTLAVWLLAGRSITVILPKQSVGVPTAQLRSMYGYGMGYAIASLSCTSAPFMAVMSMTFNRGSVLVGLIASLAYAGGMTITVGLAALTVVLAGSAAANAVRRITPRSGIIIGVVVLLTGLYVTYYGYYEIRLYFIDACPNDPIIEIAGIIQGWLARQVEALGIRVMLGALIMIAAVILGSSAMYRRSSRSRSTDPFDAH